MPKRRTLTAMPVDREHLDALIARGAISDVLYARERFMEAESFARYVRPLAGRARVHPGYLPTQAPGRWSITNPPLITFPDKGKAEARGLPELRKVVVPDPGTCWLTWDWNSMWAHFVAAASDDLEDIQALHEGWDLHCITACRALGLPLPRTLSDPAADMEWAVLHKWIGKTDRRRRLAKSTRFSLYNGIDERAVLDAAKEAREQGITPEDLLRFARLYLRSKPLYVQWKTALIERCLAAGESRTLYGRRLRLYGKRDERAKAAISHFLMGTEADIMAQTLIEVLRCYPECWLAFPAHDGVKIVVPDTPDPRENMSQMLADIRPYVERPHHIGRHDMPLPATWAVVWPDGNEEAL